MLQHLWDDACFTDEKQKLRDVKPLPKVTQPSGGAGCNQVCLPFVSMCSRLHLASFPSFKVLGFFCDSWTLVPRISCPSASPLVLDTMGGRLSKLGSME